MYYAPIFLGMLVLLAASLMACTYTTQIPLVKVARRFVFSSHFVQILLKRASLVMTLENCRRSFMKSDEAITKQDFADSLPKASVQYLGVILMADGYEVFMNRLTIGIYAFKSLAGRFAPIGVHIAMLLIMVGGTLSVTNSSFRGSVTVPQGLNFGIGDVLSPVGFLSLTNSLWTITIVERSHRFTLIFRYVILMGKRS